LIFQTHPEENSMQQFILEIVDKFGMRAYTFEIVCFYDISLIMEEFPKETDHGNNLVLFDNIDQLSMFLE